jgi:hypothetical protein
MSRVHYKNETIRKAMLELDELEQSIGWNTRCAYPGEYGWKLGERGWWEPGERLPGLREDYHQGAMEALVQTLAHLPKLRRLLDEVEAEVLDCWLKAQQEQKSGTPIKRLRPRSIGFT